MHNPPSAAPVQESQETSVPPAETSLPTVSQQQPVETPAIPEQIESTLPQVPIPEEVVPIPLPVPTKAAQPKRSKLGYAIRDDLIKKCKQIALDEDRFVYEVVEELLEEGLARRHQEI
jgi:hypothetical protein